MYQTSKLITEFIGTFFLCLIIALNGNAGVANLIAIGCVLTALIYAGGHISGAHYNPAVTLAIYIRGKIKMNEAILYWFAQFLGGIAAALLAKYIFMENPEDVSVMEMGRIGAGLTAEILGTFALTYVILNVATSKNTEGNSYFGLAIGFTVLACGYILGPYSGGAFNPAVAISQSFAGFFSWGDFWIYLVGCFVGAILAAFCFKFFSE